MFLRKLMDPNDGNGGGGGNPPGVSDLPTGAKPPPAGPDLATLQKQIKEMQDREAQYIEAINKMAERMPGDDTPAPPPADEEPLDPAVQKRVDALLTPLQRKLSQQEDLIDQQMFMNMAAASGVTPEQVGEIEKQYQTWKGTGLRTVAYDPHTRQQVERTPTRQEAMDFVLGRAARQGMLKAAPERSLQTMRQQLLGGSGFDPNAGGGGPTRRSETSYAELEALPIDQRLKKREEALDREGF